MIRKGSDYVYAVVEIPGTDKPEMGMLNHNGFEVKTPEEVDAAYETILSIKEEWGIKKVMKPRVMHGDKTFYFMDMDLNWWEVVCTHRGSYADDFGATDSDLTGRHDLDHWVDIWHNEKKLMHMHDPEVRAQTTKPE